MAYSGAMTMCSGKKIYPENDIAFSLLMIALALVVFIGISMNRRGARTIFALALALAGTLLVFISQFIQISELTYYIGCGLLLLGVWVNGSFLYFLHLTRKKFQLFSITKFYEI